MFRDPVLSPEYSSAMGGLRVPLYMESPENPLSGMSLAQEPFLIIEFPRGSGKKYVCPRVSVPVLIRLYTAGPYFGVVSCTAHYCRLPPGLEVEARDKQRAVCGKMHPGD